MSSWYTRLRRASELCQNKRKLACHLHSLKPFYLVRLILSRCHSVDMWLTQAEYLCLYRYISSWHGDKTLSFWVLSQLLQWYIDVSLSKLERFLLSNRNQISSRRFPWKPTRVPGSCQFWYCLDSYKLQWDSDDFIGVREMPISDHNCAFPHETMRTITISATKEKMVCFREYQGTMSWSYHTSRL